MLHTLFNPGPLALIVDSQGHLLDAQRRITGDPANPILARLIRRRALIDLGPTEE